MDIDKTTVFGLMENYFEDCKNNGISDFQIWCEDNTNTLEQDLLIARLKNNIEEIAYKLFEN